MKKERMKNELGINLSFLLSEHAVWLGKHNYKNHALCFCRSVWATGLRNRVARAYRAWEFDSVRHTWCVTVQNGQGSIHWPYMSLGSSAVLMQPMPRASTLQHLWVHAFLTMQRKKLFKREDMCTNHKLWMLVFDMSLFVTMLLRNCCRVGPYRC